MEQGSATFLGLSKLLPDSGSHKGTRNCEAQGCEKSTREGKPFCSNHIAQSPYIMLIQSKLDGRAEEEKVLEKGRRLISQSGFFVKEALLLLRTKDFTAKSFSRRLDISHKATERLIDLLVRWGQVKRTQTARGGSTISGLAPRDLADGI